MNLVIDIGNSYIKTAVFDQKELIKAAVCEELSEKEIENNFKQFAIKAAIVSSVAVESEVLNNYLKGLSNCINLNSSTRIPIKKNYLTPKTLGNDRLANAVGANALFPGKDVLVIDSGTCLKFDFVNSKAEYLGGAISPGLLMRYKSLHEFTEQLPLLEPIENVGLIGDNTANSIHSGVINGMIAEINDIIKQYKIISNDLQVILTGGDLRFFSNHLKNNIFAAPYLTLQGLNEILLYNQ